VYLLDTSALLTLRDDELGADQVAELLKQTQQGDARCLGCFISLMEVLYRVWLDEGEAILIHKDPEFAAVAVEQEALPFKGSV
jgi:hypothetical protein